MQKNDDDLNTYPGYLFWFILASLLMAGFTGFYQQYLTQTIANL